MSEAESVKALLMRVVAAPLGSLQVYVDVDTRHAGVEMPEWLRQQYPKSIRLVFEHAFWNPSAEDDRLKVEMQFRGIVCEIVIPYDAVTWFECTRSRPVLVQPPAKVAEVVNLADYRKRLNEPPSGGDAA